MFSSKRRFVSTLSTARELVKSRNFEAYFCGHFIPPHARDAYYIIHALNVELASVRDSIRGNVQMGHIRMTFWRDLIRHVYENKPNKHPFYQPLLKAVEDHQLTRRWFDRLVDARDDDLDGVPFERISDLEKYSEHTIGSVLHLVIESISKSPKNQFDWSNSSSLVSAAKSTSRAMGLSLILRNYPVHARLGQQYFPLALLQSHTLSETDLKISVNDVFSLDGRPLEQLAHEAAAEIKETQERMRRGGRSKEEVALEKGSALHREEALRTIYSSSPQAPAASLQAEERLLAQKQLESLSGDKLATGASSTSEPPRTLRMGKSRALEAGASSASLRAGGKTGTDVSPSKVNANETAAASISTDTLQMLPLDQLCVRKTPEVSAKIVQVVKDMALQAKQHVKDAKESLRDRNIPSDLIHAFLPLVPVEQFLNRLESQQFDILNSSRGLGPWQDGRSYARIAWQFSVLKSAVTGRM
jgi:phytoene/squalene synthetase